MTGVQDGINSGVGQFVAEILDTGLYVDTYLITFGVDNILRLVMVEILRVLLQKPNMVSILVSVDVFLVG